VKVRNLYDPARARKMGSTRQECEKEADGIVDLYLEAFQASADPARMLWRQLSIRGTRLRAGRLSHEWRTIVWKALEGYRGRCFKVAMVSTYDPSRGTFGRHWVTVTFGAQPEAFGPQTAVLDPWEKAVPEVFIGDGHEKGGWMGTRWDEAIGPGGTLIDEGGKAFGGEVGPVR
jgi:hypothetical protein